MLHPSLMAFFGHNAVCRQYIALLKMMGSCETLNGCKSRHCLRAGVGWGCVGGLTSAHEFLLNLQVP